MKKIAAFYFSGTGNTWWVSQRLAHSLKALGATATFYSIEELSIGSANRLIADCNFVGFGYPVYGSDVPAIMKDFMGRLNPAEKDTFLYCSQWLWSGDGARIGTEFIDRSFRVKWSEHFNMPNNVSVSIFRLPYTNDKDRIEKVLKKTDVKIQRFAQRIGQRPFRRGFNILSAMSGGLQRIPFRGTYERLRDDISVNQEKCTVCGYCIKICPAGNLSLEGGGVKTAGRCIICLRCYSFCPALAIQYKNKTHNRRDRPYQGPVEGFDPQCLLGK